MTQANSNAINRAEQKSLLSEMAYNPFTTASRSIAFFRRLWDNEESDIPQSNNPEAL